MRWGALTARTMIAVTATSTANQTTAMAALTQMGAALMRKTTRVPATRATTPNRLARS
jgi:hypothetical protein